MPRPTKKEQQCPYCEEPRFRLYQREGNRQVPFGWYCDECLEIVTEVFVFRGKSKALVSKELGVKYD